MGIFSFLARGSNEPEAPIDPLDRVKAAIDEFNAAMETLPPELRHYRAYVRSGDARVRRRSKLMLAYWCPCKHGFQIVYGDDTD